MCSFRRTPGMPFRRRLASVALRDELYRKADGHFPAPEVVTALLLIQSQPASTQTTQALTRSRFGRVKKPS